MENKFVVVLPICGKEFELACNQLRWMKEIGQPKTHAVALALAAGMQKEQIETLRTLASEVFHLWRTWVFSDELGRYPWPIPHNQHFQRTARAIKVFMPKERPERFWFWVEADCVPLVPEWLAVLELEFNKAITGGKKFMGAYVSVPAPHHTPDHMTGNAIYPVDLARHAPSALLAGKVAWDVNAAEEILPQAHFTTRLQHVYFTPKFPDRASLYQVKAEAVLFHQSKDGMLIKQLRNAKAHDAHVASVAGDVKTADLPKVRERRPKGVTVEMTPRLAAEIWHQWHVGPAGGGPPMTYAQIAKLHRISVSFARNVVKNPVKYGFTPPSLAAVAEA